jgi:tetratricopeptide (TPR) repeat protein
MKTHMLFALICLSLLTPSLFVQAQSPQDTLNQYVSDLQRNPSDTALRERIINLAREMNPPPAIPEEARRHYVKASTLLEDAKQPSDSADAAEEFRQALLVAPWWGEAYMKMGLAQETAQRYDEAIASLKLFMAAKPQDEVLRKTQDEIYKIEAKRDKAAKVAKAKAKEPSPEAVAAREQHTFEDLLKKIDGRRYFYPLPGAIGFAQTIDVKGKFFVTGIIKPPSRYYAGGYMSYEDQNGRFGIHGYETTVINQPDPVAPRYGVKNTYTINKEGDAITCKVVWNTGEVTECIFNWR